MIRQFGLIAFEHVIRNHLPYAYCAASYYDGYKNPYFLFITSEQENMKAWIEKQKHELCL